MVQTDGEFNKFHSVGENLHKFDFINFYANRKQFYGTQPDN